MDRKTKLFLKKVFIYVVIVPLCFCWDVFYKSMQYVMKALDWVEREGDKKVSRIYHWSHRG